MIAGRGRFSNMETVHIAAYSHLLDTIGMPETEYQAFLRYKEMKDKYDFMQQFGTDTKEDIAKTLAVFGAFTEGLQLFASFAILMNFPRVNKMKGMGQIVSWSVRDESLHTDSIIHLFRTFIDLAFELGGVEGLTGAEVKQYIRYIADRRLSQLGLQPIYRIERNPLPWMDEMLNGMEHTNYFENRATEYSKAATRGSWDEVWND